MSATTWVYDEIVSSTEYGLEVKGLYALISYLAKGKDPIDIKRLMELTGRARPTIKDYLKKLEEAKVISIARPKGERRRLLISLTDPIEARANVMLSGVRQRLADIKLRAGKDERRTSFGEALLREWTHLIIATENRVLNGRPSFLQSPLSEHTLEFDIWYPNLKLVFEFHGEQHYRTTADFPDQKALQRVQTNDLLKLGLAVRKGITVVEVRARQLTHKALEQLIPRHVPRRELDGLASVLILLEEQSTEYRQLLGRH